MPNNVAQNIINTCKGTAHMTTTNQRWHISKQISNPEVRMPDPSLAKSRGNRESNLPVFLLFIINIDIWYMHFLSYQKIIIHSKQEVASRNKRFLDSPDKYKKQKHG
jgi:hypothetical protein